MLLQFGFDQQILLSYESTENQTLQHFLFGMMMDLSHVGALLKMQCNCLRALSERADSDFLAVSKLFIQPDPLLIPKLCSKKCSHWSADSTSGCMSIACSGLVFTKSPTHQHQHQWNKVQYKILLEKQGQVGSGEYNVPAVRIDKENFGLNKARGQCHPSFLNIEFQQICTMLRCLHLFSSQKKTKTISYPQSSDSNPHRDNHLDGFIATIGITFVVVSLKEKHQYCILESFAIGVEEDYNIRVVLYCAISSNLRPDTISFQFYNARPVLHLDNKQFPVSKSNFCIKTNRSPYAYVR